MRTRARDRYVRCGRGPSRPWDLADPATAGPGTRRGRQPAAQRADRPTRERAPSRSAESDPPGRPACERQPAGARGSPLRAAAGPAFPRRPPPPFLPGRAAPLAMVHGQHPGRRTGPPGVAPDRKAASGRRGRSVRPPGKQHGAPLARRPGGPGRGAGGPGPAAGAPPPRPGRSESLFVTDPSAFRRCSAAGADRERGVNGGPESARRHRRAHGGDQRDGIGLSVPPPPIFTYLLEANKCI